MNAGRNRISDIFPILLFLVFAVSALGIVLSSAQIYQKIVERAGSDYDTDTAVAYLTEKFRSHDENGSIRAGEFKGHDAVVLEETVMDVPYVTYIYAYDGFLRELYVKEEAVPECTEDSGNRILEMEDFSAGNVSGRLIHLRFTDRKGKVRETCLSVQSGGRT